MYICIVGDSWGCGEWSDIDGQYGICHDGLYAYLTNDGHHVINLSIPGGSNIEAYNRLCAADPQGFDLILFFQSDPLRDYRQKTKTNKFYDAELFVHIEHLLHRQSTAISDHYHRLSRLDVQIHLIGGCNKILTEDLISHPNLVSFIPSVIEMLCPHLQHPNIWVSDWVHYMPNNCDPSIVEALEKTIQYQDALQNSNDPLVLRYFIPDGRHPNRHGHREIYHRVVDLIPKLPIQPE